MNWIEVNGIEEIPNGEWLVKFEEPMSEFDYGVALKYEGLSVINGRFAFDCPKVIKYCEITE